MVLIPMLSEATWESAVVYQVYWRSFLDGNGDGVGDLKGLRSKVAYLSSLGVDAIWLNPTYPSPQGDHGYDVSDYFDVDPIFGTLDELRAAIHDFHEEGIKVLLDIVPNHVSSQHPWFKAAIEGDEDGPEESRFIIRSGSGPKGASPLMTGRAFSADQHGPGSHRRQRTPRGGTCTCSTSASRT